MSDKEIQLKRLDARMETAVVDLVDEDNSLYEVFVPGAVREVTQVKADSEEEAKQKVRDLLATKQEHYASKTAPAEDASDTELDVENGVHANNAQAPGEEA